MNIKLYKPTRRIIQALSTIVIVLIPFLNIIRIDVPTQRFYFFNTVLWVEEFYFIFLFLMLFIWIILTFSMIYGRVWCGWMCPQMVLVELSTWVNTKLEKFFKVRKKDTSVAKRISVMSIYYIYVIAHSLLIGFNLVAYFVDPYNMLADIASASMGPVTAGFIIGIAILVVIDLGFWREKFCTKACPYGMIQMVITDDNTQIVRYQTEREADCIKCNACVKTCVMGIDIRKSPYQTECTHCGDCVDACTIVLSKLKQPKPTLINFSWGEGKTEKTGNFFHRIGLFDVKRWVLITFSLLFMGVIILMSQIRQPIDVSLLGDRSTLYRTGEQNEIINDYILKITNRGIENDEIDILFPQSLTSDSKEEIHPINLEVGETKRIRLSLVHSDSTLHPGPNRLHIQFKSQKNTDVQIDQEVVFFMPERY